VEVLSGLASQVIAQLAVLIGAVLYACAAMFGLLAIIIGVAAINGQFSSTKR